jgi:hypothetical protein
MATVLHHIFQKQGIPPDEVMAKPPGVRAFMFASTRKQVEVDNNQGEEVG